MTIRKAIKCADEYPCPYMGTVRTPTALSGRGYCLQTPHLESSQYCLLPSIVSAPRASNVNCTGWHWLRQRFLGGPPAPPTRGLRSAIETMTRAALSNRGWSWSSLTLFIRREKLLCYRGGSHPQLKLACHIAHPSVCMSIPTGLFLESPTDTLDLLSNKTRLLAPF